MKILHLCLSSSLKKEEDSFQVKSKYCLGKDLNLSQIDLREVAGGHLSVIPQQRHLHQPI